MLKSGGLLSIASKPMISEKIRRTFAAVLENHFPNGMRNNSPIELSRFRRVAAEDYGEKIALDDEELAMLILSYGMLFNGKVYIVGTDVKERIKHEIDSAISEGVGVIFYSAFYGRHEDWLFPARVFSEEMLKAIILNLYPRYVHRKSYL